MAPRQTEKGFLSATYEQITSPENTTIVRSILVFGVGVAFLHSSLSELLLPPPEVFKRLQTHRKPRMECLNMVNTIMHL